MGWLDRRFRLAERGSNVRTELAAGLTTFVTLSYILFVQPALLSNEACGMDPGGVLFATCVASAIACFLMGWWANHPIALAPAMGHNVFFVFVVCKELGFTWQEALAANFVAGALFLALAPLRFRERIMEAIPDPLKYSIAAGIGLLIAFVGFAWGGIVVDDPVIYVRLGDLRQPVALLTVFGLVVTSILLVRGVRAATLIGIVATASVGWLASAAFEGVELVRPAAGLMGAPPAPTAALELDFPGLLHRPLGDWLAVVAVFFLLDLFDTIGTLVGVGDQAGLLVDGKLPRARGALAADATGTTVGALLGTSTVTAYVESAAGVAAGGRTGLTAIACGGCLLAALFLRPLIETVGAGVVVELGGAPFTCYPVLAPILILIGGLMLRSVRRIDWADTSQAIPCFLTIAVMPLSLSITDGIAWGVIAWSLLSLGSRRPGSPAVHVLAAVFLLRYLFL